MAGDDAYILEGLAAPEMLDLLHELLARVGEEHTEVGTEDLAMIETAILEIAGNLVEHGRPAGRVAYSFSLHVLPDRLEGRLSDSGAELPDDPTGQEMPDELAEHGRGLALAEAALDELSYERVGNANTWTFVRFRRDKGAGPGA